MRKFKGMYYIGALLSMLVSLWHFTVPWMFGWADYIPYETLVVPIHYVNLCFSFLLSGLSLIMLLLLVPFVKIIWSMRKMRLPRRGEQFPGHAPAIPDDVPQGRHHADRAGIPHVQRPGGGAGDKALFGAGAAMLAKEG